MNKTESKYFSTAARMDEAFLALLEKKDLPYITVKEICQQAGVNRSTFYLHYETIGDLLAESVQYMTERFLDHMRQRTEPFAASDTPLSAGRAYFITPEYLEPYLSYSCSAQPWSNPPFCGWTRYTSGCSAMCFPPFWSNFRSRRKIVRI